MLDHLNTRLRASTDALAARDRAKVAAVIDAYRRTVSAQREWENRNPAEAFGENGILAISERAGKVSDDLQSALAILAAADAKEAGDD